MVKKNSKAAKKATVKKVTLKKVAPVKKTAKTFASETSMKKTAKKSVSRSSSTASKPVEKIKNVSAVSSKTRSDRDKELFEKLKELLLKRKMEIIYAFDETPTESDETIKQSDVGDVVDTATDATENEINLKLAEYGSRELGQIENALVKMSEGSYGICEDCGGNISMARIKALPFASKCIKCQQEEDENGKDFYNDSV